jgi:ring-1,2-phenylacetyl-CoA epoxidase subunit PaaA
MQRLSREGIIDATPDELRRRYLHTIMPTLSSLEIEVPVIFEIEAKDWVLREALPWQTWDPVARRLIPAERGGKQSPSSDESMASQR